MFASPLVVLTRFVGAAESGVGVGQIDGIEPTLRTGCL